jgi:hypothetical protein
LRGEFDTVVSFNALHRIPEQTAPLKAIREMWDTADLNL